MEKKTKVLIPDEILVGPDSRFEGEKGESSRSYASRQGEVFSQIRDTRFANFFAAMGYFALLVVCLVAGGAIVLLNILGRFLGTSGQVNISQFFQLVGLLFLRMLGFLLGAFYPPWGQMFLRFTGR